MIKQQLDRFNRLDLLGHPTPLEKLDRLSSWLGRDIYIKRDDLTPLALGGNKLRKLEFHLGEALKNGVDTLITVGGIQSNHARLTAAVCARLGLACELILTRSVPKADTDYELNGNVLLDQLFGAQMQVFASGTDSLAKAEARARQVTGVGAWYFAGADHIGAQLCEGHAAQWRGDESRTFDDAKAGENSCHLTCPVAARSAGSLRNSSA